MTTEAIAKGQAAGAGSGTKGSSGMQTTHDPATISAVSRTGSPAECLSSAFQSACRNAAPRTASVTPSERSDAGNLKASRRGRDSRVAFYAMPVRARQVSDAARRTLGEIDVLAAFGGRRFRRRGRHQPRACEHARLLEDRIRDRAEMRVDPSHVGDEVEMQRRGLDALDRVAGEPLQVRIGVRALEVADEHFLREQLLRALLVPVEEDAGRETQVADEAAVHVADLHHPRLGEAARLVDLAVLDVGEDAL